MGRKFVKFKRGLASVNHNWNADISRFIEHFIVSKYKLSLHTAGVYLAEGEARVPSMSRASRSAK